MKNIIFFLFISLFSSLLEAKQDTLKNKINAKLGFKTYFVTPAFQQFSFNYLQNGNSIFMTQQNIASFTSNGLNVGIEKFFTKNIYFSLNTARTFGNTNLSGLSLGVGFEKKLQNKISFFGGLDFSFQRLEHKIGNFFVNDALVIQNRTFNNENIEVSLANQMLGISPKIGLSMQLNSCFGLYGQINYFVPITNTSYARFSNGNIFPTKVANIDLNTNSNDFIFQNNSGKLTQTPFTTNFLSLEIGLIIRGKR